MKERTEKQGTQLRVRGRSRNHAKHTGTLHETEGLHNVKETVKHEQVLCSSNLTRHMLEKKKDRGGRKDGRTMYDAKDGDEG